MDKAQEAQIRAIVQTEFSRIIDKINAKQSSAKITRNTSGKITIDIKAYEKDIVTCVNKSRAAFKFMAQQYFPDDSHTEDVMPPLEAYEDDVPGKAVDADFEDVAPTPEPPAAAFDGDEEVSGFE